MNVLLTLASSSITGPAERMLGNARALVAAGHSARLAFDTVRPGNFAEVARSGGFAYEEKLALSRKPTPGQIVGDIGRLRALFRAGGLDLVHSHFSHDHHLVLLAAAGRRSAMRIVRAAESPASVRPTLARRLAYQRTDAIEVATEARKAALVEGLGIDPQRVAVLPGAVDPVRFAPSARGRPSKLREQLGLAPGVPLVGIVARMKPERRHRELIAAFAALRSEFQAARLALIGRGEGEGDLRAQVASLGLEAAVLFAGYWANDDLVEAYRGLDVAVWLADGNDGSARGVLEAMACAVPVVAAGGGAASEALSAGKTGLIVPPGDVQSLSVAIGRLLRDPAERRALGDAARARVLRHHTWAQRGPGLLTFYDHVRALPPVA